MSLVMQADRLRDLTHDRLAGVPVRATPKKSKKAAKGARAAS
jgi:hypothetical protein